jgi:hypothetical protein
MIMHLLSSGAARPPSLRTVIVTSLAAVCSIKDQEDGFRITTHCLYPSNGLVRVTVRGGLHSIVASDEGEALGEALSAGIELSDPDKFVGNFVKQRGLLLRKGVIYTKSISLDAAPVAILHVANTAKELANWLYDHGGVKRRHDFRQLLAAFLSETFRDQVTESRITGASQKPHRFANVISFANGRRFIVDAVSNDPASVNARVVANLDVKAMQDPSIEQRIVYDDSEKWAAADLNLLKVGATIVPFSGAMNVIRRIAEETRTAA